MIEELIKISEQDEHIRALLDRKDKIQQLKAMTVGKIKEYSYTRTLKTVVQKEPTVQVTTTFTKPVQVT